MLRHTFCHFPGVGAKTERSLWDSGHVSWASLLGEAAESLSAKKRDRLRCLAAESEQHLAAGDIAYFYEKLPSNQHWRMFPEFQDSVAYLDIETTGLSSDSDYITTIALYDGSEIYSFVRDDNLGDFADCIMDYDLLVTYNGKTFDVPFIRHHLGIRIEQAHIDLRYVLASLGLSGGLKACEKKFNLHREDLTDIDGYFAVLLWYEYENSGDKLALETLRAYNVADVVNLSYLMPMAYNMKIQDTPVARTHLLPPVTLPENPYRADMPTIQRIRNKHGMW